MNVGGDPSRPEASARTPTPQSPVLLWIDDQIDEMKWFISRLAREGWVVHAAKNGTVGLHLIERMSYDAILLDLRMPEFSGLQVLEILRSRPAAPPVVVVTGYGTTDLALEAGRMGAAAFAAKTRDGAAVVEAVRRVMADRTRGPLFAAQTGGATFRQIRTLLERLETLGVEGADLEDEFRRDAIAEVASALREPDLTFLQFAAVVVSLCWLCLRPHSSEAKQAFDTFRTVLGRAESARPMDARLAELINAVDAAGAAWRNFDEESAARRIRVHRSTLWNLLSHEVHFTFPELRRVIITRRAVLWLPDRAMSVKEVAARLGYADDSEFCHAFRRSLGMSPGGFRRLGSTKPLEARRALATS